MVNSVNRKTLLSNIFFIIFKYINSDLTMNLKIIGYS